MTVTVGCVVARNYAEFLPGWFASVARLAKQPDEVVVVTDIDVLPNDVRRIQAPSGPFHWPEWHRALFDACETDYVSWVNADDRYEPHALTDWPSSDVVIYGNQFTTGSDDVASLLEVRYNHVPCGSPVRLEAYRRSPGFVDLMPYSDWGLWVGLAKTGATFARTGRVDYLYRTHPETPTAVEPTRSRIRAWAASL